MAFPNSWDGLGHLKKGKFDHMNGSASVRHLKRLTPLTANVAHRPSTFGPWAHTEKVADKEYRK
ncbi:MAG: hypothetical protein HQ477_12735 [Chloroflexi bacterium]|nr:hypothetical protein [Chloroflexota bacterium]